MERLLHAARNGLRDIAQRVDDLSVGVPLGGVPRPSDYDYEVPCDTCFAAEFTYTTTISIDGDCPDPITITTTLTPHALVSCLWNGQSSELPLYLTSGLETDGETWTLNLQALCAPPAYGTAIYEGTATRDCAVITLDFVSQDTHPVNWPARIIIYRVE